MCLEFKFMIINMLKNTKIGSFFIFFWLLFAQLGVSCQPSNNVFQAAASMVNVTPHKGAKVLANRQVHDSLYAKTLVLDDGKERLVFIIVDNQGIPAYLIDEAKKQIYQETQIPPSHILVAATHTHTAISAGSAPINLNSDQKFNDYQQLLVEKMVEGTRMAINNLQPAQIGWGSFDKEEYVFNRRWYMKDPVTNPFGLLDSVKTNPGYLHPENLVGPAGPTDPEVSFLAVKSISGEPISVLANYSLHYIGGTNSGDVSADYYGELGRRLESLLVEKKSEISYPFVGIMSNGTSGDVNNFNFAAPKENLPAYEKIKSAADDIARSIVDQYNQIEFYEWVPLKATSMEINLKLRRPSRSLKRNVTKIQQFSGEEPIFDSREKQYTTRLRSFVNRYPRKTSFTLQAFAIGDLGIGAIPFEVFAETGLELKKKNPFSQSFTIGLANGHWGYLPTPQQHKKGGYETWITISRVKENSSKKIVRKMQRLFTALKD